MNGVTIKLDVDDAAMKAAVRDLSERGMKAASRRAVLKTARIGRRVLQSATRAAMHDEPGGYEPFSPAAFKVPKAKTEFGGISASTGYTRAGFADRLRSTGTGPRFRHEGFLTPGLLSTGYTGTEMGLGMTQIAAHAVDPQFPHIADLEMDAEIAKEGLK